MWRLGTSKSKPVSQFKNLGVVAHRLQESNVKLHQIRRFVHNRRTAGPKSRLQIWHSAAWATAASGLVDVGLTDETASLVRAWHAAKNPCSA